MNKSALLLSMVLTMCGCADLIKEGAAPGIKIEDIRAPYAKIQMDKVVFLDSRLQEINGPGKIAVESNTAKFTSTGNMEVKALLRNRTNHPLQVEARVSFFNNTLVAIDEPSAWQRLYLPPNSFATFKDYSSISSGIKHYCVEIREAK